MNKIRVNLKRGVKSWRFALYDSVESAFYLKGESLDGVIDDSNKPYRRIVTLSPGESLEAEWMGSEWVYDEEVSSSSNEIHEKFDRIRLGKVTPLSGNDYKSRYLEIYSGWVPGGILSWSAESTQDALKITPITGRMRSRFDFSKIFQDRDAEEPASDSLN